MSQKTSVIFCHRRYFSFQTLDSRQNSNECSSDWTLNTNGVILYSMCFFFSSGNGGGGSSQMTLGDRSLAALNFVSASEWWNYCCNSILESASMLRQSIVPSGRIVYIQRAVDAVIHPFAKSTLATASTVEQVLVPRATWWWLDASALTYS